MKVYARSDVGRVRPINEDAYLLPEAGERFCAVADGMGGHNAGEVASALAIEAFAQNMRHTRRHDAHALRHAVEFANTAVKEASLQRDCYSGMGTTFTALCQCGDEVHIAHVGDSRAYLIRNGSLVRVTIDHTLVEEMVMQGLITPQEARRHPRRNLITRALGTSEWVDVDLFQVRWQSGDIFFLCTDGLSNHVSERQLLDIVAREASWEEKVSAAVDAALEDGSTDNVTGMFVIPEEKEARQ